MQLLVALRPHHWIKNAFVLAPIVFAGKMGQRAETLAAFRVFAVFCAASSFIYLLNDIADRNSDARHPRKKRRPVASGRLPTGWAMSGLVVLGTILSLALLLERRETVLLVATYVALHVAYSVSLSKYRYIDVVIVAAGFVLRELAGGAATQVPTTPWLLACTFSLCLFLGFGKRLAELVELSWDKSSRDSLRAAYTPETLHRSLLVSASATLLSYSLYSLFSTTSLYTGRLSLILTTPLVAYCMLRYWKLARRGQTGDVIVLLVSDWRFLLSLLAWTAFVVLALYTPLLEL